MLVKARALLRAARMALHLMQGLMLALCYPWFNRQVQRHIVQRWSAGMLNILGIRIHSERGLHHLPPGIIVSNHISWLDIFVLNAVMPMRFVAKSEVRRWPLIGWMCSRAKTLFIDRTRARDTLRINQQLVNLLKEGERLTVFPEGTTTDGREVGAFHASLLQPAIDAGVKIHPVAILYQDAQGAHCKKAAYIDDDTLIASLWRIFNCSGLHVSLTTTAELDTAQGDRRALSLQARAQISQAIQSLHASEQPPSLSLHPSLKNDRSLYGMLLFSPLPEQETPPAID